MKAQLGNLMTFVMLFIAFTIVAYVLHIVIGAIPYAPAQAWLSGFDAFVMAFVDNSLIILLLFGVVLDLYSSFENPSRVKAIINIVGVFLVGYLALFVQNIVGVITLFNSTALSTTTGFLNGGYLVFLLLFGLVFSAILNLRHKENEGY
jgi:hypothetical protein